MDNLPRVSILMPIYNRNIFLPLIILNLNSLLYDKIKLEICIDDDGTEKLFKDSSQLKKFIDDIYPISVNYKHVTNRRSIGAKRNNLTFKMASNKLCANMDSDDIYMPTYLLYGVSELVNQNKSCVGSNQMLFVYPLLDFKMTGISCESKRQVHEASLIYYVKHARAMGGFKKSNQGEGSKMVDFNDKNVGLLDIDKCMICVCHNDNTIDKKMFEDCQDMKCEITELYKKILTNIICL